MPPTAEIPPEDDEDDIPVVELAPVPRAPWWVRGVLVVFALGFAALFGVALSLRPYEDDGAPKTMSTHTQLGLPPCNMIALTGKPCPTCGMTTSFAHVVRGNLLSSARANWVGTIMALYGMALIPWAIRSAWRGRLWGIHSGEALMTVTLAVFTVLMLLRWVVVLIT